MAKPFTLDIKGLDKLQKKVASLPAKLQKEVGGEIEAATREINARQLRLVPVDEGGLKQQTGYKKVNLLEWELFSGKHYAPYIEFGTKSKVQVPAELRDFAIQFKGKGQGGGSFDEFFLIILDWVKRKGIAGRFSVKTKRRVGSKFQQLDEDFAAAYPIALSIIRKGIKAQPFFFPPFFLVRKDLIDKVRKIVDDI
jgi:hypothetical protein